MSFDLIYPRELDEVLRRLQAVLIDIRSREDYQRNHYKNAIHLEYETLMDGNFEFPKDRYLLFYCSHGGASSAIARMYAKRGYRCGTVVGGFVAMNR